MELTRVMQRIGIITTRSIADGPAEPPTPAGPSLPSRNDLTGDPRGLDAVFRALNVLETAARQLTVDVWRGPYRLDRSRTPSVVLKPDVNLMSFGAFIAETVSSMSQRGNAYWRISRGPAGDAINVTVLNPLHMWVWDDTAGARHYSYRGSEILAADLLHLRLTHTPGEPTGLGPIQACMSSIIGAQRMRAYADNWMDTRSAPAGQLTTDQELTRAQAEQYKEQAIKSLQFSAGPAVFGKGVKYERLLLNPQELQWLDSQQANVTMIARMFGIPARTMLAAVPGNSQTYANLQEENNTFIKFTLMSYLAEIEDALTALTPRGQSVRFNLDAFLRPDTKTRMETHKLAIDAGIYSPAEARDIEGLSPVNEGATTDAA